MGVAYQRGQLLYGQKRWAMAATEFARELEANPNDARALAMLAMSLTYDGKIDQGLDRAKAAVAAEPGLAFAHYMLANVHVQQGLAAMRRQPRAFRLRFSADPSRHYHQIQRKLAKPAILEALRLDPANADHCATYSGIELDLRKVKLSLEWAERGLISNPNHLGCANLRAKALSRLGRVNDAHSTLQTALRINPESAHTHATAGWTLMQAGKPLQALAHFTEAVRLNPNDENARRGYMEARLSAWFIGRKYYAFAQWAKRPLGRLLVILAVVTTFTAPQFVDVSKHAEAIGAVALSVMLAIGLFVLITLPIRLWRRCHRSWIERRMQKGEGLPPVN